MKNLINLTCILVYGYFHAQQVYPLNTPPYQTPNNSYFKDFNNELDPYIGKWKASFKEKTTILVVEKQVKAAFYRYNRNFFQDRLLIRYEVTDKNGNILESTIDKDFTKDSYLLLRGYKIDEKGRVISIFYGGKCNLGNGLVYLQKTNDKQFLWSYYPQGILVTDLDECNGNIYLPEAENLVFTKQ